MTSTSSPKTIAFFGATGGCGLSSLKLALADGHTCVALCRSASKLTDQFPAAEYPNLTVRQGNAHDVDAVSSCLTHPEDPSRLVDEVLFCIGGAMQMVKRTIDDPNVCERGMETVIAALTSLRAKLQLPAQASSSDSSSSSHPLIVAISTTGISKAGRDIPMAMIPLYHGLLKVPHADKLAMEEKLAASSERFVLVRPSLLTDGAVPARKIRVGIERVGLESQGLPAVVERKEVGYGISREDTGRWIYQNLLAAAHPEFVGKAVSITW
ncbi:hypothetical protein BX600DRAFT_440776 [Xylariales sp. PMI_506]|nr:hypothetical protein BX600DRAFT_440776 [Xylariales sp. PMI_506]